MIPAHFIELEHFPLTPNGKIDRKALPAPDEQAIEDLNVLPRTPSEELIASVWSQVLGTENIGIQDSFFERGGHSLLATQIVSRLQEMFQIKIPLRELSSTIQWKHWRNEDQLRKEDKTRGCSSCTYETRRSYPTFLCAETSMVYRSINAK